MAAISDYRRQLDLSNGIVSTTYQYHGASYRREVFASHPDDVIVIRLTQTGGGSYTGSVTLTGTHGETTRGETTGGSPPPRSPARSTTGCGTAPWSRPPARPAGSRSTAPR